MILTAAELMEEQPVSVGWNMTFYKPSKNTRRMKERKRMGRKASLRTAARMCSDERSQVHRV